MIYCTLTSDAGHEPALLLSDRALTFARLARDTGAELPGSLLELIEAGDAELRRAFERWRREHGPDDLPRREQVGSFALPFRPPGKIWGIGLNYRDHAADLDERVPPAPASFNKPASAVIGPGDDIVLPAASRRVTAEAELGVILGARARDLAPEDALAAIFGYTVIVDMTAEDILRVNPRFLTRSKSFDTFIGFGPVIVTPDEIDDLMAVRVEIVVNGAAGPTNVVANMTYPPLDLIAFHSRGMSWEPGDILSTGTPGAVVIQDGDRVVCRVAGVGELENRVRRDRS